MAAVVGALAGGGGMRAFGRLIGPGRDAELADYYRGVIEGLIEENTSLRAEMTGLRERVTALEDETRELPDFLS